MSRTTQSYSAVWKAGDMERDVDGPALDEQRMRAEGTAELHDEYGVVFGVAHWRWLHVGMRWCAHSLARPNVRTIGKNVAAVTRQLARKLETR